MTQDSQNEPPRHKGKVFVMRSKAGHWMYEVHDDADKVSGGGGGFEDEWSALEAAQEAFPSLDLDSVIQAEAGYMVKATGQAPE